MQFVREPSRFSVPGSCVLIPGRMRDPRGFIDTQTEIDGRNGPIKVYLSAAGIRTAAQRYPQLGLVDVDALNSEKERNADLANDVERLEARVAELEDNENRIIGLRKAGFVVQKKVGGHQPKAKTKEPTA